MASKTCRDARNVFGATQSLCGIPANIQDRHDAIAAPGPVRGGRHQFKPDDTVRLMRDPRLVRLVDESAVQRLNA